MPWGRATAPGISQRCPAAGPRQSLHPPRLRRPPPFAQWSSGRLPLTAVVRVECFSDRTALGLVSAWNTHLPATVCQNGLHLVPAITRNVLVITFDVPTVKPAPCPSLPPLQTTLSPKQNSGLICTFLNPFTATDPTPPCFSLELILGCG